VLEIFSEADLIDFIQSRVEAKITESDLVEEIWERCAGPEYGTPLGVFNELFGPKIGREQVSIILIKLCL
jgi:hypothetical protein